MSGLLIKDLRNVTAQGKIVGILLLVYVFFGIKSKDFSMLLTMFTLFAALMPVNALAYDERAKWDRYALTMPISRRALVLEKYLFGLLLVLPVGILAFFLGFYQGGLNAMEAVSQGLTYVSLAVIYISITLPICFKLGVEKGRIAMIVAVMIPVVIVMAFSGGLGGMIQLNFLFKILPILAVLAAVISVFVSLSIYETKEF